MLSVRAFLSGLNRFFALLNTLSHSANNTGIERVSKGYGVFPIFVKLRCVERSVFDPIVSDLRHLLSRAQGSTALYP